MFAMFPPAAMLSSYSCTKSAAAQSKNLNLPSKNHILHLQIRLLLQHLRILRPLTQPHTPQVNSLGPIPRGHGQLMTPRPRCARDARIVDTVVDSAERFDALTHHALDVRLD